MKLLISAVLKFLFGILLVGLLVFLPAGTFKFFGGWLFCCVLFIPMLMLGVVLFIKSPNLLKKRLDAKETEKTQRGVVGLSAVVFIGGFLVAGLDFRFKWLPLPKTAMIVASVVFLLSYVLYAEVMRENAYLSRKIEVAENQKVIDTGLYGVVRHPMYMATVIMFLSIPLILGSIYSFLVFLGYPVIIAIRIKNEEQVLTERLSGYAEYKQKVKYRLIPFIW